MDCIVDKASGFIDKERIDEFESQFSLLWEKEKKLIALADTKEEKKLINDIINSFKKLEPIIKNDLKNLIESNASDEAFEKLDNDIDAVAGNMDNDIETLINSINSELQEANKLEKEYSSSMKISIMISIVLVILISILLSTYLSKSIISGLRLLNSSIKELIEEKGKNSRVDIHTKDELGEIANNFNIYLEDIEKGLIQDKKLIEEAKEIINKVKRGWYSNYIESTTSNKSLNEFKNEVNEMIKATKENIENVNKVLILFSKYDYRSEIKLDNIEKGGVFESLINDINSLKNSITSMLIENKKNGMILTNSANQLLSNVTTLNNNANEAAVSLEQTAAALDEITGNISNNTSNII